ncbi:MAG: hypothetical protein U9N04_00865 [Patescibacteria group bacterium]|nr:hypothetical protein [Patescibacteria group bacterium]
MALFIFAISCLVKMIFEGEGTTASLVIAGVLGMITGLSLEDALIRFVPLKCWNDDNDSE